MRGKPLQNFPAFCQAAIHLRSLGHVIENPAEHDLAAGVNPSATADEWPITVAEMLKQDFALIADCDGIVLLPGWEDSVGTSFELVVARAMEKKVYTYVPRIFGALVQQRIEYANIAHHLRPVSCED